jgi:hypothetical protein
MKIEVSVEGWGKVSFHNMDEAREALAQLQDGLELQERRHKLESLQDGEFLMMSGKVYRPVGGLNGKTYARYEWFDYINLEGISDETIRTIKL